MAAPISLRYGHDRVRHIPACPIGPVQLVTRDTLAFHHSVSGSFTEGILHERGFLGDQGFRDAIDVLGHHTEFVLVTFFQFLDGHLSAGDSIGAANPFAALLVAFLDDVISSEGLVVIS